MHKIGTFFFASLALVASFLVPSAAFAFDREISPLLGFALSSVAPTPEPMCLRTPVLAEVADPAPLAPEYLASWRTDGHSLLDPRRPA